MWEMARVGENKKLFILGVTHSNTSQEKPIPSQRIADALNQSSIYAMESDSSEKFNVNALARLPRDDKLSAHLENSAMEQLKEYIKNSNLPKRNPEFFEKYIESYHPLALYFLLISLPNIPTTKQELLSLQEKIKQHSEGMDSVLKNLAVQSQKKLAFLESADDLFDSWNQNCNSKSLSTKLISSTIQLIQKNEPDEKFLRLEKYIAKGDENGFNLLYEQIIKTDGLSGIYFDCLIKPRSKRWISRIEQLLAEHGSILVAVGAGHLYGQSSLVELLKRDGFVVISSPTMQNSRP